MPDFPSPRSRRVESRPQSTATSARAAVPDHRLAQAMHPVIEHLEHRRLLHGEVSISVDFTAPGGDVESGWVADVGRAYGLKTNSGLRYGWMRNSGFWRNTRTANHAASQGLSIDDATANSLGHRGGLAWEIALPNGAYSVTVAAGDAQTTSSAPARVAAEGEVILEHTPTAAVPFAETTAVVEVADGRLTLSAPDGPAATQLLYVQLQAVHVGEEPGQSPFSSSPINVPGRVEAEHFDLGGQDVAFYDRDPDVNHGGALRDDGPDLVVGGDNVAIAWARRGEWLEYTVESESDVELALSVRASSGVEGAKLRFTLDNEPVGSAVSVRNEGWADYATYSAGTFAIGSGEHVLRVTFDSDLADPDAIGANVDWVQMSLHTPDGGGGSPSDGGGDDGGAHDGGELQLGGFSDRAESLHAHHEAVVESIGGKMYVFGGFDDGWTWDATKFSEVYDPATDTWTRIADMPTAVTHVPHVVYDGKIWFFGGHTSGGSNVQQLDDVYYYDPQTDSWTFVTKLEHVTSGGGAAMIGNRVHVMAGYYLNDSGHFTAHSYHHVSLDLTNPGAGWRTEPDVPIGRDHPATAVVDGKIYLIGGQFEDGQYDNVRSDVWRYDPATEQWTQMASLPAERAHIAPATTVYRGRILVAGGNFNGEPNENIADEIFAYDPQSNTWDLLGHLPEARRSAQVRVIDDQLFIAGGGTSYPRSQLWRAEISEVV